MVIKDQRLRGANRRNILRAGGVGSLALLAGCLGDDDDPVADDIDPADDTDDSADDSGTTDDTDDTDVVADDDADDADDDPDTVDIQSVEPVTALWHTLEEHPADLQWNPYGGDGPVWWAFRDSQARMIELSWADLHQHGNVVDSWDYQPGLLEFTIHDDFYWWSGDQMTIDDYLYNFELMNFVAGGDELDAHDTIVVAQRIDDFTARLSLADTWREPWALAQTIEGDRPTEASRAFTGPWIERFDDAPDLDTVEDLREAWGDERHDTDEEIIHDYYAPYEFRFDDSIGEIGADYIEFELVQEKNGNVRHSANLANSDRWSNIQTLRAEVVEEDSVWSTEHFMAQEKPSAAWNEDLEDQVDFDVNLVQFFRPPYEPFAFQFNHGVHPGDDVHFRRAWAYATDISAWQTFEQIPVEHHHGFLSDQELETFVSQDVIDAFTDYGWNEHRWDDAEAELLAGGYERDGSGNWLLQDDSIDGDAGEPMDFEITTYGFTDYILDEATDFWADLADFGIQNEVILDTGVAWGAGEDYVVTAQYTGGGSPENAFTPIFVEAPANRNAYNVPSTILAPELYETTSVAPDTDDWIEYDVEAMTTRLGVTTEAEAYQALVDRLAWAVNQTVPHFTVTVRAATHLMNNETWSFMDHDQYPEKAVRLPFRIHFYGAYQAQP